MWVGWWIRIISSVRVGMVSPSREILFELQTEDGVNKSEKNGLWGFNK